jgi:molybdate transport system regulatory protein
MKFEYNGKLYVQIDGERVFGPGRVELLERIIASGSIRKAAKEMEMSYRQAWQFIDHMNTHFGQPVVIAERGGKGGGKTVVTPFGLQAIKEFKVFHAKLQEFLKKHSFSINIKE